jgi:type II secretory pathway component GspD/PulD (secretin)
VLPQAIACFLDSIEQNLSMRLFLVLLIFLAGQSLGQAERIDQVYSFGSAHPDEVEQVLQQVLSKEGKMVILKDKGKVLIQDVASTHETVELLLADLSKPRPNVKVEVIFNEEASTNERRADLGFRTGGRDIQIGNRPGPGNTVEIDLMNRKTSTQHRAGQFLVVQSGSSASLRVVQEVPFVDYFYQYALGRGYVVESQTRWRDIGTQMSVRPRVRGQLIDVELMPQITRLVDGRSETIDYRDLVTTVTVAPGQEVSVGGFQGAGDEFNRNFFLGGRSRQSTHSAGFKIRASLFQY